MFKKLSKQLKNINNNTAPAKLPYGEQFITPKNEYLKKISQKAVELYERQSDITHFSKLVLSNPENTQHNNLVEDLFKSGVADPFVDEKLAALSDNKKFLKDLGLL